jgi:U4/U6 small nuclear ribonucleoprotein PRP31
MSTLADELLQDFEDFGGDEETVHDDVFEGDASPVAHTLMGDMSEGEDDEDDVMEDVADDVKAVGAMDDADQAKSKVEKMKLDAVKDVRSVATLMDTLGPVLQVRRLPINSPPPPEVS